MSDPTITIIGNLTGDPELRTVQGDAVVAHFTVASSPRIFDRESREWKDGETLFLRCSLWRQSADNLVASLHKGDRVIVFGRLVQRSFEIDGGNRKIVEVEVDEIGPSLRFATVRVTKTATGKDADDRQPTASPT